MPYGRARRPVGSSVVSAPDHPSRSKARESPVSSGPIRTPTNAGEGPQRGSQRRERGSWEAPAGGRRGEDALPCADREPELHPQGTPEHLRRRSEDGPPPGARREASRRESTETPPELRVGSPAGECRAPVGLRRLRTGPRKGARPARVARPAPELERTGRAPVPARCRNRWWLRRIFAQAQSHCRCSIDITWYRERPRAQHLGVGYAFPHEGLS